MARHVNLQQPGKDSPVSPLAILHEPSSVGACSRDQAMADLPRESGTIDDRTVCCFIDYEILRQHPPPRNPLQ